MTDPEMADATYIEPIHWKWYARLLKKSARTRCCQPWASDGAELRAGAGTSGRVGRVRVTMIGATADAIDKAEDRRRST